MFEINTGISNERRIGMMEGAAMDACEHDADRATVLTKAADLILSKLYRLRSAAGVRRNFWMNADLIAEMVEVAPDAHDRLVEYLFFATQPAESADEFCDAIDPMPPVE